MRSFLRTHLSETRLLAIADGEAQALSSEAAHLAGCGSCSARLRAHRQVGQALGGRWESTRVSGPTQSVRPSPGWFAAVAVAALVVVLAVRIGTLPNPDGTAAAPSPTHSSRPTAVSSPTPSAQTAGIHLSRQAFIGSLSWSPDGGHLLLDSGGIEVIDARGQTVATPGAILATWVDSRRFATWSPASDGPDGGSVVVYRLDGSSSQVPGTYQGRGFIGNGVGGLTLMPVSDGGQDQSDRFVVWTDGVLGDAMPGWPLGWSNDGSTLIVATSPPLGGTAGSAQSVAIAVMSRPFTAGARPLEDIHVDPSYTPSFDPDGAHVAFQCAAKGQLGTCHQLVIDIPSGRVHDIATQPPGLPLTWRTNGDLLLAATSYPAPGALLTWDGSDVAPAALPRASWAMVSSSGYVALVTEAPDATNTTRIIDPSGASVADLPGTAGSWSDDGFEVAIGADSGHDVTLLSVR